jgi:ABC-2 type transport system ATP-binding protein
MRRIEVHNVTKRFRRQQTRRLLGQRLADIFRRPEEAHAFHALRNITFSVGAGESVALIGANGAGKSTLLSLITGLLEPDAGTIQVNGRIAPMLELGSSFHPDLDGSENVYLNAALLGLSEDEARAIFDAIVDFAEIGDFIHEPLRNYSRGMILRLAFSVAAHVNPAVLIADEVLGVGDGHFQEKSAAKVMELRRAGSALLCVSHDPQFVTRICERGLWLHQGELVLDSTADAAVAAYTAFLDNPGFAPFTSRG